MARSRIRATMAAVLAPVALMAFATPAQGAFGTPLAVGPGGDAFDRPPQVGASNAGDYVVLYENGGVRVGTKTAAAASFTSASLGTSGTDFASLAVAGNGAAVVAWVASPTEVKIAHRPDAATAAFGTPSTITAAPNGNIAAGIDDAGNAVVAWRQAAGVRYALSTGATFGAPDTVPAPIPTAGFDGEDSGSQVDNGPRAFRDNTGNVVLAYRSGGTPVVARRAAADGAWTSTTLGMTGVNNIKADADPASRRVFVAARTSAGAFKAFEGATDSTTYTPVIDLASTGSHFAVAVRPGGTETLASYLVSGNLTGAGCRNAYAPAVIAVSPAPSSTAVALTTGHDGVAAWGSAAGGLAVRGNSRDPSGNWSTPGDLEATNLGGVAAAADGAGGGAVVYVKSGGQANAVFYTESASTTTTQCAAMGAPAPPSGAGPGTGSGTGAMTPPTTPRPAVADRIAPALSLFGLKKRTRAQIAASGFEVRCRIRERGSCQLEVSISRADALKLGLTIARRAKTLRIATKTATVGAAGTAKLVAKPSAKVRKRIRSRRVRIKYKLTVTARDRARNARKTSTSFSA